MSRVATRRASVLYRPPVAASDWWTVSGKTCVAAYQPKGAASLAASYVNLANPGTNNAAEGTAPTFAAATGWTFAGASSQYLNTGILLTGTYTALIRYSDAATNDAEVLGFFNNNQRFALRPLTSASTAVGYGYGNAGILSQAPQLVAGVLGLTAAAGYRDGTSDKAMTGTWSGTANYGLTIGGRRRGDILGAMDSFFTGAVQAVALYSDTLTAGEMATVSAAMAAL